MYLEHVQPHLRRKLCNRKYPRPQGQLCLTTFVFGLDLTHSDESVIETSRNGSSLQEAGEKEKEDDSEQSMGLSPEARESDRHRREAEEREQGQAHSGAMEKTGQQESCVDLCRETSSTCSEEAHSKNGGGNVLPLSMSGKQAEEAEATVCKMTSKCPLIVIVIVAIIVIIAIIE